MMPPQRTPGRPAAPSPDDLTGRFREAADANGFALHAIGRSRRDRPLIALHRAAPGEGDPGFLVTGAVHGDEPAGPLALLSLLESGRLQRSVAWTLIPLINPDGLATATRENADGIDLNRDFRNPRSPEIQAVTQYLEGAGSPAPFRAAFDLHEDWESTGFYAYELNPDGRPDPATAVISAARPHTGIDRSPQIDDRPTAGNGMIYPPLVNPDLPGWPQTLYLLSRNHTRQGFTFEAPSTQAMERRVAVLGATLLAATALLASS